MGSDQELGFRAGWAGNMDTHEGRGFSTICARGVLTGPRVAACLEKNIMQQHTQHTLLAHNTHLCAAPEAQCPPCPAHHAGMFLQHQANAQTESHSTTHVQSRAQVRMTCGTCPPCNSMCADVNQPFLASILAPLTNHTNTPATLKPARRMFAVGAMYSSSNAEAR